MLDTTPAGPPVLTVQVLKRKVDRPERPKRMTTAQKVAHGQASIHVTLWVSHEPDVAIIATDQFVPGPDHRPAYHYGEAIKTALLATPVVAKKLYTSSKSAESALDRLVANLTEWAERGTSTEEMLAIVGRWADGKKITPAPDPERDAVLAEAKAAREVEEVQKAVAEAERVAALPDGPTFRMDRVFVPYEKRPERPDIASKVERDARRMAITMLYAWIEGDGDTVCLSEGPIPGSFQVSHGPAVDVAPTTRDYTQTRDAIGAVTVLASKSYANHRSAGEAMDRVVSQLQEHADTGADQATIRALAVEWGQGGRIGLASTRSTYVVSVTVPHRQPAAPQEVTSDDTQEGTQDFVVPLGPPPVNYTPWILGAVAVGVLVMFSLMLSK